MSAEQKPLLVVVGATGAQGSSVVRHVLPTGKFRIRGITRDANGEKAQKLKKEFADIELVEANLNDKSSLVRAFQGAHTVFAVTNFWDPEVLADHGKEITQGKNLADAAEEAGVQYYIWSSLADCERESNGSIRVPHFDQKHEIQRYVATKKFKAIYFYASFYYQNWVNFAPPQKSDDGTVQFILPVKADQPIHMFDVDDTGKIIAKVLENPDEFVGKDVSSTGDALTLSQVAEAFSRATGKKAAGVSITDDQFKAVMPEAWYKELSVMYKWFSEYGYYGKQRDPWVGKHVTGDQMTKLEKWFKDSGFTGPQ